MKTLTTNIAGVTHDKRQGYLNYIKRQNAADIRLTFKREPNNPYDNNAIRVCARNIQTGKYVECGYIPAKTAKTLAPLMDAGIFIFATGFKITGLSQTTLGMNVTICHR